MTPVPASIETPGAGDRPAGSRAARGTVILLIVNRLARPRTILVLSEVVLLVATLATWWVRRPPAETADEAYRRQYGSWQIINLPDNLQVNAIHAAVLSTGKLLLVAGSGFDRDQFAAGTFVTLLYDPNTGQGKLINTPIDLFCAGHAFLPDGNLLISGGTARFEVDEPEVTSAAGIVTVTNSTAKARTFAKGTIFRASGGRRYASGYAFTVPAGTGGKPGTLDVWAQAKVEGKKQVTGDVRLTIDGLTGAESGRFTATTGGMTMDYQDYQGTKAAYEFSPVTERYERVANMHAARWYPTLTGLPDGEVLAVSGVDETGRILDGSQNEIYDPSTKRWTIRPDLNKFFPTYPALFQTATPQVMFYAGINMGSHTDQRESPPPGLWRLDNNAFQPVPGLREPSLVETGGSAWVGPIQNQTIMVVGGGGKEDSELATSRIDLIKLNEANPRFVPGPDLPGPTRYPIVVSLPDDTMLITNGARYFRGRNASDNHDARLYHPDTNTLSYAAPPLVGRNYHSSGILLPDGRVLTMGSSPQYADAANTVAGTFEKRLEIYTPPYLYRGDRPGITQANETMGYGQSTHIGVTDPQDIGAVRLIRPAATTHLTNVESRSVAVDFTADRDGLNLTVTDRRELAPPGYYMLFVISKSGVPSVARWVHLTGSAP
jgi:hypothetical protein